MSRVRRHPTTLDSTSCGAAGGERSNQGVDETNLLARATLSCATKPGQQIAPPQRAVPTSSSPTFRLSPEFMGMGFPDRQHLGRPEPHGY